MTVGRQIILDLLLKFPKASSKAVGRMAFKEAPAVFKDAEAARDVVRALRGAHGKRCGTQLVPPTDFSAKDPYAQFPEGKKELADWNPVVIAGPAKMLVLSDVHIPFHDKPALMKAIDYGKDHGANAVLLNGDLIDFHWASKFIKDPRHRNYKEELDATREFLKALRGDFPTARIIYKLGNHEERYETYMRAKAPELLGVADFRLENLLRLGELGIRYVSDKRPIRCGDLNVLHGHEYRFAISNPVNPARGLFLRCKSYALCGHFHQASHHTEKTVEQKLIATWSTGCLCDLHPEYSPLNSWVHGFALVDVAADGKFELQDRVIREGKVY